MTDITKKTAKGGRSTARQATKFATDETLEFIKSGKKQVVGTSVEKLATNGSQQQTAQKNEDDIQRDQELARLKAQSKRQVEALEREIADIVRQKQERDRQRQAAEDAKKQQLVEAGMSEGVVEPPTKKKRGVLKGMKGKVDKMTKKTEMRNPPSG